MTESHDPALRALLALRIETGYEGDWERGFNAALDRVADEVLSLPGWERAAYAPALAAAEAAPLDVRKAVVAEFRERVVKAKGTQKALDYGQLLDWSWDSVLDAQQRAALAATSREASDE